jgi:PAS domain S-box-containing protein
MWPFIRHLMLPAVLVATLAGSLTWLLPALAVPIAVLVAFCAVWMGASLIERTYRHELSSLQSLTHQLMRNHATGSLERRARQWHWPSVEELYQQVQAFANSHRAALDQLVALQERIERRQIGPRGLGTHFVVGSSRHRMVARLALNLHIMAATPPLRAVLGQPASELLGVSMLRFVHTDDHDLFRQAIREAHKDGEAHNVTIRLLTPDRPPGLRHMQLDILASYDDLERVQHFRCHFLDVSDRIFAQQLLLQSTREVSEANARLRQTNEDLQRLKESYRDLYHHAPVLYFSLDAAGRVVACNETMLNVLGYPRERILHQDYALLLPPAARSVYQANPQALLQPGEVETQWRKMDGTIIDVWIGTTIIRDVNNQFVRSRSAARDITENRRLSNALRQHAEQLSRANEQLRRINQELEEFSYVVSHDLKEPLRTIETFSTFLIEDYREKLQGEGLDYLSHVTQASRRLGKLIDDLLTLSRTGRVIHTPRLFDLAAVLSNVLADLHDLIDRRGAVVRIIEPLPSAVGDAERIGQLFSNLITNAIKYNRSSQPEVEIGVRPSNENAAGQLTFYVKDNGIGIDPAHHQQIFRIFRRLHARDEFEGTGAGLAICKRIVEAHGGRIWVESAPGQGATFLFTLPREPLGLASAEVRRENTALVARR